MCISLHVTQNVKCAGPQSGKGTRDPVQSVRPWKWWEVQCRSPRSSPNMVHWSTGKVKPSSSMWKRQSGMEWQNPSEVRSEWRSYGRSVTYRQMDQVSKHTKQWQVLHCKRITEMEREKTRMNGVVLNWHWKYQCKLMILHIHIHLCYCLVAKFCLTHLRPHGL